MGAACSKKADTTVSKNPALDVNLAKKKVSEEPPLSREERQQLEKQKAEEIEKLKEGTNFIDYGLEDAFTPPPVGMRIVPLDFLSVVKHDEQLLATMVEAKAATHEDIEEHIDSSGLRSAKSGEYSTEVRPRDEVDQVRNDDEA